MRRALVAGSREAVLRLTRPERPGCGSLAAPRRVCPVAKASRRLILPENERLALEIASESAQNNFPKTSVVNTHLETPGVIVSFL